MERAEMGIVWAVYGIGMFAITALFGFVLTRFLIKPVKQHEIVNVNARQQ